VFDILSRAVINRGFWLELIFEEDEAEKTNRQIHKRSRRAEPGWT